MSSFRGTDNHLAQFLSTGHLARIPFRLSTSSPTAISVSATEYTMEGNLFPNWQQYGLWYHPPTDIFLTPEQASHCAASCPFCQLLSSRSALVLPCPICIRPILLSLSTPAWVANAAAVFSEAWLSKDGSHYPGPWMNHPPCVLFNLPSG